MSTRTNQEEKYYTYIYLDPRKSGDFIYQRGIDEIYCFNFVPFYIGKGKDDRLNYHLKCYDSDKNGLKKNTIKKIRKAGLEPIIIKILQNVTDGEALAEEIKLISIVGRRDLGKGPLCNMTDGGDGIGGSEGITDLKDKKFGRLSVLELVGKDKHGCHKWKCLCECGNNKIALGTRLVRGKILSCGCLIGDTSRTHGLTNTPIYRIWKRTKYLCIHPNNANYKFYGGRGIKVCDRWMESFENFYEDMGDKPSDEYALSREDRDGDFTPENCKWVLKEELEQYKINSVHITIDGEKLPIKKWSKLSGTPCMYIRDRLHRGWPEKEAVFGRQKEK